MSLPVLNVVGKPGQHDSAGVSILTGKADFVADRLPNQKYFGAVRPANFTRGKITNIDASEALKLAGVKAVVTYQDIPSWSPTVLHWGQPVAGVVAEDPYIAERALPLIKIDYTPAPAVVDPDEAIKPGATLSGVMLETNLSVQANLSRGDLEAGWANADVVEDASWNWTTVHQHQTLETNVALAWWVGEHAYVWGSTQSAHSEKSTLINTLNMPATKIHFYTHFCGSGEGGKGAALGTVAVPMSKAVGGYPVLMSWSRRVQMGTYTRQFQVRSEIKLGAKNDGTFTAADATWWAMGGVNSATPSGSAHFGFRTTYTIPDAKMVVNLIGTNSPQRGYYRCVNDPPGNINSDSAIDKLAVRLGMDPYDLRMKNLRPMDAPDQDSPYRQWGNGGAGGGVRMCFEKVYQESNYATKKHNPGAYQLENGKMHGIAITGHLDSHGSVGGGSRGGNLVLTPDGQVQLNVGGARGTPGAETTMAHFVAEVMGLKYDDVGIGEWGNTDISLDSGIQAGSGFTGG
ncbi:MAG: molybdopterin-dependent oxidoreductase, partial [Dehalococcoidia bacterium]|nr:molybdopterin-dependent oxidoreductase [Dehalococcoidia bacterium]